jgi:hypothetical protein
MSINKNKLRTAVNKMKREAVTSHRLWNPLKNSFVKVFRMQNITLEVIRETIYNFWIVFKDIRTWSEVSELAYIVNRYLSDVVGEDILTEDSFNLYERVHPPRLNESESEDELPLHMSAVTIAATNAVREYGGETKSSISPDMADLLRQAREYDLRKAAEQRARNNPVNMLRQTSLSNHPAPKEAEVFTALLGSDESPNPQNVDDIERMMTEHLVNSNESARWDQAARLAKRKRYEKEGRLDELGGGRRRKTFLRKRSQKRKYKRKKPFSKKGRKTKRKTFLRKRSQKQKKRKQRKRTKRKRTKRKRTKRKLNKRTRRRGGNNNAAKKIQKVVRGRQSRKKTVQRLAQNPFATNSTSRDGQTMSKRRGSYIARSYGISPQSNTLLAKDTKEASEKRVRESDSQSRQILIDDLVGKPFSREYLEEITSPARLLRMNSVEDHLPERERRVRQSIKRGGKTRRKKYRNLIQK